MALKGLDEELGAVLRTGPFHLALRTAIEARGLSLQRVQHHLERYGLRVGVTSLSYWQQGVRRPERAESLRAVRALEEILGLPPESLTALLGPPRPRGRNAGMPPGTLAYGALISPADTVDALLADLGCADVDGRVHTVTMYERLEVSADHRAHRRRTVQVVRAHQDCADRYVVVWTGQPGGDVAQVELRALDNCRVAGSAATRTA